VERKGPGGGNPLQEANGDVPLDGVAFSKLLEWGHKFLDFGGKKRFKMGSFSVKKNQKVFITFNNKLALTALYSVLETTLIRR